MAWRVAGNVRNDNANFNIDLYVHTYMAKEVVCKGLWIGVHSKPSLVSEREANLSWLFRSTTLPGGTKKFLRCSAPEGRTGWWVEVRRVLRSPWTSMCYYILHTALLRCSLPHFSLIDDPVHQRDPIRRLRPSFHFSPRNATELRARNRAYSSLPALQQRPEVVETRVYLVYPLTGVLRGLQTAFLLWAHLEGRSILQRSEVAQWERQRMIIPLNGVARSSVPWLRRD